MKVACQHSVQSGLYGSVASLRACHQCPTLPRASRAHPLPSLHPRYRRCSSLRCALGNQVNEMRISPGAGIPRHQKQALYMTCNCSVRMDILLHEYSLFIGHHSALRSSKRKPGPSIDWGDTGASIEGGQLWVSTLMGRASSSLYLANCI